jgi:YebC/PmpR family DNA-binding regulatory protein
MSGHSKWAGIKHQKAINDARRGNLFTKLANNISVASKQGGGNVEFNPALRMAVEKARQANMPKDNIEKAIKRGTGELGGAIVEELRYEAFGPGNVAMIIEALTDNRNRTNSDIRTIVTKQGGRMAEGGGVLFQFNQRGVIRLDLPSEKSDALEEVAIESGAEDYVLGEGFAVVYTTVPELHAIKDAIVAAGFVVNSASVEWVAKNPSEVSDSDLEKVAKLLDALDENDDVTNVYTSLAE